MYKEKLNDILNDIENKEVDIAGGAIVGMVLSITNSLIKYISNLTVGKKKYLDVQDKVNEILVDAENLKKQTLNIIDKDKDILEKILDAYKLRKENYDNYIKVNKEAVDFCIEVLKLAFETLKLAREISKVGNRMLASDFKICAYYSYASVESAIVNVEINLNSIEDEDYKKQIKDECINIQNEAEKIKKEITDKGV